MVRTVPSFRIALESETAGWRDFRGFLRSIDSKEDLDSMFDQARTNCMAAGNAVRPVVFEGMFMAMAFSHEKRLANIGKAVEAGDEARRGFGGPWILSISSSAS